ncbi:MAG: hypothetical protein M5U19_06725 [Microthrixaceae bacterium]|nr:hypothetical protein [Microthrixaceae bacterium]
MAHERIDGTPVIEPRDPAHPRPWLRRDGWTCLEGTWDFALDADAALTSPAEVDFGSRIVVPFAPETPASGVGFDGFLRRCWYRKRVAVPDLADGERLLVHFGAVDRIATVWADGSQVAHHVGGHTGFSADITDAATIASEGYVELIVRADDDPRRMDVPRGKQDWAAEPHMIWYPRTTGIWQTVWMEVVPATLITDLRWTGDPTDMTVSVEVTVEGDPVAGDHLTILLAVHDRRLVEDCVTITEVTDGRAQVVRSMRVGTPGVDDPFALIWRPGTPTLIDARITYRPAGRGHGTSGIDTDHTVDTVDSYTAIRSVEVTDGRVCLNGRPTRLMLALDQGYWPDSGMTAPSLDALQHDVDMIRSPRAQRGAQAPEGGRIRAGSRCATKQACSCGRRCRAPSPGPATSLPPSLRSGPGWFCVTATTRASWPGCR